MGKVNCGKFKNQVNKKISSEKKTLKRNTRDKTPRKEKQPEISLKLLEFIQNEVKKATPENNYEKFTTRFFDHMIMLNLTYIKQYVRDVRTSEGKRKVHLCLEMLRELKSLLGFSADLQKMYDEICKKVEDRENEK